VGKKTDPTAVGPGKCRICPRYEHAQTVCVQGHGPTAPQYIVILGTPSLIDDTWCQICDRPQTHLCREQSHENGKVLSDAAGHALRSVFMRARIDPQTVFYTSAIRCAGDPPGMIHTRRCRAYLLDEIEALDLTFCQGIMLLGDAAVKSVLNRGHISVKETRGRVLDTFAPSWGPPVRATYHPVELLLRDKSKRIHDEMVEDFLDLQKPRDPVLFTTIALHPPDKHPPMILGIDLEWTAQNTIRCIGLSDGRWKIAIPGVSTHDVLDWIRGGRNTC